MADQFYSFLLETFHASNNELTGSIPDEVYGMTSLTTLRLSENGLTGSLSTKVGQLVNLGMYTALWSTRILLFHHQFLTYPIE